MDVVDVEVVEEEELVEIEEIEDPYSEASPCHTPTRKEMELDTTPKEDSWIT